MSDGSFSEQGDAGRGSRPVFARSRFSFSRAGVGLAAIALFAGMLFWTKLRLTADIPRSAYAVPNEIEAGPRGATPDNEGEGSDPDTRTADDDEAESPLTDR